MDMKKKTIKFDLPLQIAFFVYQYAKQRMLEFYYDFMMKFVDRSDFEYLAMDTDSAYMAVSGSSIEDIIKPDMRAIYEKEKHFWFPRTDSKENAAYDKRCPGLFHLEKSGTAMVSLCSKTYYVEGDDGKPKYSSKGIQKRGNPVDINTYLNVLKTKQSSSGTNKGFRVKNNSIYTYVQERCGFSYFYPKRKELDDGVSTCPLDI